jgi:predicted MFS family arabinose efflux permease
MSNLEQPSLPVSSVRLRYQLAVFTLLRTVFNTSFRMIYPFLPAISRGLGVGVETLTLGITLRSALGLFSPIIGSVADLRGRRFAMLAATSLFTVSMLMVFVWPTYIALIVAMVLTGATKTIFEPAMYAYVGDRVDYRQRGLVVGLLEFGWSGAFLVGIPFSGWLMARAGWSAPFPFLALMGAGLLMILWRVLPHDRPHPTKRSSLRAGLSTVLHSRAALAGLAIGLLTSLSNEVVNIIYGVWMDKAFALEVASLGAASAVIGVSELLGEGLVAALSDRLGKKRSLGVGLVLYLLACLALPALGGTLEGALVGLFLFYLTFEFVIVCTIPLMTELAPKARATLLAANGAGHSLGRMLGSLIGPALFVSGLWTNALVAVVLNLVALVLLWAFIHEDAPHKAG